MKVVSASQMASIEKKAYKNGFSESNFMEEAGKGIALAVGQFIVENKRSKDVVVLCGKGNNGGDAFVAARYLLMMDCNVHAIHMHPIKVCSPLCQKNYQRFIAEGGSSCQYESYEDLVFPQQGVVLDGLFGTGFHGDIEEPYASVIEVVNRSGLPIIAVDIPSGLNGDTGEVGGEAIIANETIYLELPKTGFFLENGWNHVGSLKQADFGLPAEYIEESEADFVMSTEEMMKPLLPPIVRNRHKYEAGLVVGLAGSPGMPGAAMLSSLAALRGGAGIVRLLHSDGMQGELAFSPYELIKIPYQEKDSKGILEELNKASAVFIGPGMGRTPETRRLLKKVLPHVLKPCVIDGDALTILAEDNIPFPQFAVLTPHKGEMLRLLKKKDKPSLNKKFLNTCRTYSEKNNVTLILKGGPSFIFHPGEEVVVNPTGDPGMATAGSGDVLTGLIAALLAQGLNLHSAALLGVYLHGLAGEKAVRARGVSYGLIASDIINYFQDAFLFD